MLVACSGGASPSEGGTPAPSSPSPSPSVGTPTPGALEPPEASGAGFCEDRGLVGRALRIVRAGDSPFGQVAAYVGAVAGIVRADAREVPDPQGRFKVRQLSIAIDTLRLAVEGAADNYDQGDYAVRQLVRAIPSRVASVSGAVGC